MVKTGHGILLIGVFAALRLPVCLYFYLAIFKHCLNFYEFIIVDHYLPLQPIMNIVMSGRELIRHIFLLESRKYKRKNIAMIMSFRGPNQHISQAICCKARKYHACYVTAQKGFLEIFQYVCGPFCAVPSIQDIFRPFATTFVKYAG